MTKEKTRPPAKKSRDPEEKIRLVATREEIIETKLTQNQIDEMQRENLVLDNEVERLEEKKAEAMKNFASQLKTIELQKSEIRRMVNAAKRRETVTVEEYLTGSNEIVRFRKDTGDRIGQRTATARELQEDMFPDKAPVTTDSEDPPQNGAPATDDAFPAEFGGDPG